MFVTSVDEYGQAIDFDTNKIKVTVTATTPSPKKSKPVIKLNRLTKEDISKYTNIDAPKSSAKKTDPIASISSVHTAVAVAASTSKRKRDVESSKLTVSKKPKLSEDMQSPNVEMNSIRNNPESENVLAIREFRLNEIVWGKIKGWPHWPCKIIQFNAKRYVVEWLNDYRTTVVFPSQIFKFMPNFQKFSAACPKSVGLETAVKEALISMARQSK